MGWIWGIALPGVNRGGQKDPLEISRIVWLRELLENKKAFPSESPTGKTTLLSEPPIGFEPMTGRLRIETNKRSNYPASDTPIYGGQWPKIGLSGHI